jgi:trigger factor
MAAAVTTKTTELGDSRVRVEVEVPSDALERELKSAAAELGREMRVPGFRSGKVPPEVVLRQVGREAVMDEAVRRGLPAWYEQAVHDAGITTVGDPELDLTDLPEKGSPLSFTIEIGVVPPAELGEYKGLEVGRREPSVDSQEVQAELERLRESLASLDTVERAAGQGDFVVIDFTGSVAERRPPGAEGDDPPGEPFEGGEARGHLVELGSGRLIPGFEEQLDGVSAGDERQVKVTFPDDYPAEHLAGKDASFAVEVKEVKEKRLPELDDDFAVEAGGYDSLDELRAEIEQRIGQAEGRAIEGEFREAAVDAAVHAAKVQIPHELVHAKAHEMWHRTARRFAAQGLDPSRYLEMSGKTEEELVTEAEPDAELALKREAVLAAIVKAEGIEVSDEEVSAAMREAAGPDATDKQVKRALKRARQQGAEEALREDIAMRKAVDLLVESAKPIPADQAAAREKLWTPEKGKEEQGAGQIWTPGS